MDYSLPDGTGADATRSILADLPQTKVLFMTIHEGDNYLLSAIRSGAKGYLLKDTSLKKPITSIRALDHNEPAISRNNTLHLMDELARSSAEGRRDAPLPADLSDRELEILRELARYASNQEIADKLSISVPTVKNHIHRLFVKLNLNGRQEIARYARNHQL
jgi:two-component system response regulator DegU